MTGRSKWIAGGLVGLLTLVAACKIPATWSRTYTAEGWRHVYVRGATASTEGGVLLFGSQVNYDSEAVAAGREADIYLQRYDADGALSWKKTYDLDGRDSPMWMDTDDIGNIYFWSFGDNGNQTVKLDSRGEVLWQIARGYYDVAFDGDRVLLAHGDGVGCYDAADGTLLWEHQHAFQGPDRVAVDTAGNVFVAGAVVEPAHATENNPPVDIELTKLDPDGVVLWQVTDGAPGWSDSVGDIVTTSAGGVVITAEVELTADYSGVVTRLYDPEGALVWHDEYANSKAFDNYPEDLTLDAQGNIVVLSVSVRLSKSIFEATNDERVVTKLAPDGRVLWRTVEGGFAIANRGMVTHSLRIDDGGNIYATGANLTHAFRGDNGGQLAEIQDDSTLETNFLALGDDGEVYLTTTLQTASTHEVLVERYERP
jgi:PQQ-like domain